MTNIPRIMVAGTASGSGKTTVTLALLSALRGRGLKISAFKCGPDYIDPLFHREVLGAECCNLDSFFCSGGTLNYLFQKNSAGADLALAEGAMGYFDGYSAEKGSSYEIARVLGMPVLLVVDCAGMANSAIAVVKGFKDFKKDGGITGVILNNITERTYKKIKPDMEKFSGIKAYGFFPKLGDELKLKSRHLGLVTAAEVSGLSRIIGELGAQAEKTLDLDGILKEAGYAKPLPKPRINLPERKGKIRVAVARDKAFCFYYRDNIRLLEELGAEIIYFSPLSDKKLPEADGLIIGGGYPELHAGALSENISMRNSVKSALERGLPCVAECGGYMYLGQSIDGKKMAGFLQGRFENKGKLVRFGYAELTALTDNMLCVRGESIKGHEFHYYDCADNGSDFEAKKPSGAREYACGYGRENLYAGFVHLHFYSNLKAAANFCAKCAEVKK